MLGECRLLSLKIIYFSQLVYSSFFRMCVYYIRVSKYIIEDYQVLCLLQYFTAVWPGSRKKKQSCEEKNHFWWIFPIPLEKTWHCIFFWIYGWILIFFVMSIFFLKIYQICYHFTYVESLHNKNCSLIKLAIHEVRTRFLSILGDIKNPGLHTLMISFIRLCCIYIEIMSLTHTVI